MGGGGLLCDGAGGSKPETRGSPVPHRRAPAAGVWLGSERSKRPMGIVGARPCGRGGEKGDKGDKVRAGRLSRGLSLALSHPILQAIWMPLKDQDRQIPRNQSRSAAKPTECRARPPKCERTFLESTGRMHRRFWYSSRNIGRRAAVSDFALIGLKPPVGCWHQYRIRPTAEDSMIAGRSCDDQQLLVRRAVPSPWII
jgi:hypothetical protein